MKQIKRVIPRYNKKEIIEEINFIHNKIDFIRDNMIYKKNNIFIIIYNFISKHRKEITIFKVLWNIIKLIILGAGALDIIDLILDLIL